MGINKLLCYLNTVRILRPFQYRAADLNKIVKNVFKKQVNNA